MEFGVLGSLEIRVGGTEVRLGAPKLRALLTSLLLEAGRVVPTERLVDDLWGEDATDQALVSLRSYVSNLRRVVRHHDGASPIVTRGRGYVLDVAPESVDAVRFEAMARQGRDLVEAEPARALELLDTALALWRGPALADVADLPFARAPIARLNELRLTATEDRFEAMLRLGRTSEVVAEAEALVAREPLRERPHAQLMLALYRAGRAADALAVHRRHREHLADELGLDASANIDGLADAILRRDPALDPAVAVTAARLPPVPAVPTTDTDTSTSPALVGRDAELARLARTLQRLRAGEGSVVVVGGEPGIGKTALVRELGRQAADVGLPVVWGRCHETQGAPAFWPWTQVLRTLAEAVDDETLGREVAGAAAGVVQLVPELAARTGQQADVSASDPHAARFALHDAVLAFLARRAAVHGGLVVVIDDLHWGDLASLELVVLLASRARQARVLLAVAHRDTGADRTPELEACLAGVAREDGVTTLALGGLSPDDTAQLVAALEDGEVDASTAEDLHRRAGGNPFFVRQLAQLRAESGGDLGTSAVPVGVRHVIVRRLQLLPADVRVTLDAASVLGQYVDARPLARARGLPLPQVVDHLDTAADHGLVESTGGITTWRFVHALIRDTLTTELPQGRLARLHVAAADALEALPSPPTQAIAEHLWQAADLVESERPIRWLRAAAEEALAVFAYEQGEDHLRRALHLLAHDPGASPEVELAVRLRLVQWLTSMYGWASPAVREVAARACELAGVADLGPGLVSLRWPLWSQYMTRGQLAEAEEAARDLLADVVHEGAPAAVVAGHVAVAYTGTFTGMARDELLGHVAAAEVAVVDADPESLAATPEHLAVALCTTRGIVHALLGDADPAIAGVEAAVAEAVGLGHPFAEAYARMFGGFAAAALDLPEVARGWTSPAIEICDRMELVHLANLTIPSHGWACARTGEDPGLQAARMARAIEELTAAGHRHALPMWWTLYAEVSLLAGDRTGAGTALGRAREIAVELGERAYDRQFARVGALVSAPPGRLSRL